jgi:hypothetical protein
MRKSDAKIFAPFMAESPGNTALSVGTRPANKKSYLLNPFSTLVADAGGSMTINGVILYA